MNVPRQRYPKHACRLTTRGDSQNDSHPIHIHIYKYIDTLTEYTEYIEEKNKSARYLTDRRWRRFRTRDVFDVARSDGDFARLGKGSGRVAWIHRERRNVCRTRRRPIDWLKRHRQIATQRKPRHGRDATFAKPVNPLSSSDQQL